MCVFNELHCQHWFASVACWLSLSDMLGHVLSAVTDIVLRVEDYRGISATRLILNMSVCEKFLSGVEPFQPES